VPIHVVSTRSVDRAAAFHVEPSTSGVVGRHGPPPTSISVSSRLRLREPSDVLVIAWLCVELAYGAGRAVGRDDRLLAVLVILGDHAEPSRSVFGEAPAPDADWHWRSMHRRPDVRPIPTSSSSLQIQCPPTLERPRGARGDRRASTPGGGLSHPTSTAIPRLRRRLRARAGGSSRTR